MYNCNNLKMAKLKPKHAVGVVLTINISVLKVFISKVKVKVTLVQALRLCTGRTAHRESRGIALPFLDHGTRRG